MAELSARDRARMYWTYWAASATSSLGSAVTSVGLPLRGTQVTLDLVRAAALVSVPLAWWWDVLTLAQLIGVALVISFADVLFDVSNLTFMPRVVPPEDLQRRNSLNSGTHAVTQLGGPGLGGVLVQLMGAVPT